ncbi:MAG: glycosyltransferase family 4 protein [Anaerolineaceae bacterium]
MHILLVADGRSPITRRWVSALAALQHRVSLISSFPCNEPEGVSALHVMPVAFAGLGGSQIRAARGPSSRRPHQLVSRFRSVFLLGRYYLGPLSLPFYTRRFRRLVAEIKPDLVHALRIPFEGMLASQTPASIPLAVTIWGNDLTYHAHGSPWMKAFTLRTLRRANGLMADAHRDIRLGQMWGFSPDRPALVVPGGAGIDLAEMHHLRAKFAESFADLLPAGVPMVVNPRGFRPGSVRNDVFFQSIPLVLERMPKVFFVCTAMAGQAEALKWVQQLKLERHIRLLPFLLQPQLWDLFVRSNAFVSVSAHDGTPNSFLEGIACGCFPVVGDIESLREWVTPGVNGFLVEPDKPQALADALVIALDNPDLLAGASEKNLQIIRQRAEAGLVRAQIEIFYQRLAGLASTSPTTKL